MEAGSEEGGGVVMAIGRLFLPRSGDLISIVAGAPAGFFCGKVAPLPPAETKSKMRRFSLMRPGRGMLLTRRIHCASTPSHWLMTNSLMK